MSQWENAILLVSSTMVHHYTVASKYEEGIDALGIHWKCTKDQTVINALPNHVVFLYALS